MIKKILCFFLLSSCITNVQKYNFYNLESFPINETCNNKIIFIDNVELPDYIDRPQFVVIEKNILKYKDKERWIEPLSLDIQKTIVNNLNKNCNVNLYNLVNRNFDYLVNIKIKKIDIILNENINFEASITFKNNKGKNLFTIDYKDNIKISKDFKDIVYKLSLIIKNLSYKINSFLII